MYFVLFGLMLASALGQETTTIDPSVLVDIFGPPPTAAPAVTTSPNFEDGKTIDPLVLLIVFGPETTTATPGTTPHNGVITVKPSTAPTILIDKNGQSCQCVPYYLCDRDNVAVDANNASVTGYGELDIRFGEETCQESVEKCCTNPKNPSEVPRPKPDPSKLKGCGYRNPKGVGVTITGGSGAEAQFGEFPWVIAILDGLNGSYIGVGVLIHPQVVMTGAHIAARSASGALRIRAGEWDTQTVKEIFDHQERDVQDIYVHNDFNPNSLWNDVALLRLAQPLQLGEHINMICLPDQDESFDDKKNCVANGWGKNVFGLKGRYAVFLKKVEQDMVPHGRCNTLLQRTRLGSRFKLHTSFVCAGGEEGKDTCQGDGGAPLACPIGNDRYKLSGLVAWGIGCGQRDVPAVYAAAALFRRWVDAKMSEWGYGTTTYTI